MLEAAGTVLDRNACRNCRRPIALLARIGWVHDELPKYADEPITCTKPVPVEYRCPVCGELQPKNQDKRVARHDHPEGGVCPGSHEPGIPPPLGA